MSGKQVTIKALSGSSGGGIPEAPIDNTPYSREDAGWVSAPSVADVNQVASDLTTHENDTDVHLSTDERAAIDNTAFPPTAANPFATQGNINLKEDSLGNPAIDGQILSSTILGVRTWISPAGATVGEAPIDGTPYSRQDAIWISAPTALQVSTNTTDIGTVAGDLSTHESDTANPHAVTAVQVGADPTGTAAGVQLNLTTHENDINNPHNVSWSQTGSDQLGSAAAVSIDLGNHATDTDLHITATERLAIDNSPNTPTGANPFATIADVGGGGGGDMMSAMYDPTNVMADAFNMDNMVAGVTNLILSPGQAASITSNTLKVSNAAHTGDVVGDTGLVIQPGVVDIAMLSATGTPSATTYLRGDNTWALVSGGGISDAPSDGSLYGRRNALWEVAATAAQGTLADSALQNGDNVSELINDAGYITSAGVITDHTALTNIGTNTHGQIDIHIADLSTNPHAVTQAQVGLPAVDNTSDADKPVSTATQTALDLKEDDLGNPSTDGDVLSSTILGVRTWITPGSGGVTNHSGLVLDDGTNPHGTTQTDVGLSAVDNTSDLDKPISTDTQTALDLKATAADLTSHENDTNNPHAVDAADVNLGNVDNTSDVNKPISIATQTALDLKEDDLNNPTTDGDILSSTILGVRSWVTPGGGGTLIHSGLTLDDGTNPHGTTQSDVGLGAVDNTSDADKPVSTATQTALDGKVDDAQVLTDVPVGALFTDTIYDSTAVDAHMADITTNPHDVTAALVGLGNVDNTSDVNKPVSTDQQTEIDTKVNWRGIWDGSEHFLNDMSRNGDWLMIANTATFDNPAPVPNGDPSYSITEAFPAITLNNSSVVWSGQRYTFTQPGWMQSLRIYAPEVDANTKYRVLMLDITNPTTPISTVLAAPTAVADQWATVALGQVTVAKGSVLEFYLDALNSGSDTQVIGGWRNDGTSNNSVPGAEGWNRSNNGTKVRIDKTDLDTIDRESELLGVTPESIIRVVETAVPANFIEYLVTGLLTDGTTDVEYPTTIIASVGSIPMSATCTITITIPVPSPTEYSTTAGYWTTNPDPSWASVEGLLSFDGVAQASQENNAFGIDLEFQPANVSDDWDFLSSANTAGAGGGGGATSVHNDLTGRSVVDAHPISAVTGLQTALDLKENDLGNPSTDGDVLSSTILGARIWITAPQGATGLGILDQGNGDGWRLIGRIPTDFGTIGLEGIDLSYQDTANLGGAIGNYSFASGSNTRAVGVGSTAMGYFSEANASYSYSEGEAFNQGYGAHAEGKSLLIASAELLSKYAHTEGEGSITDSYAAHAEGQGTIAAGSDYSHAEGNGTVQAGSLNSHAEGNGIVSGGAQFAHAEGTGNASDAAAHAEGLLTTASGQAAHAEGTLSAASGDNSHAGGSSSIASAQSAFAHGVSAEATAAGSNALGTSTIADIADATALGKFNLGGDVNNIVEVGIGTATPDRKNGLAVRLDGIVTAPQATTAVIGATLEPRALITKEYGDANYLGGGVTVHNNLTGRSDPDTHPVSAITGLQTALDGKIENDKGGTTGVISALWLGTEAEYTALGVYDATILYFRTA